jgi:hypothetical protein
MTSFRKLWTALVNSIKPQMLRESTMGPHSIYVDTRPFNVANFSSKGR